MTSITIKTLEGFALLKLQMLKHGYFMCKIFVFQNLVIYKYGIQISKYNSLFEP